MIRRLLAVLSYKARPRVVRRHDIDWVAVARAVAETERARIASERKKP